MSEKIEVGFTLEFNPSGIDGVETIADKDRFLEGFNDSVKEFCADLEKFINSQPLIIGCKHKITKI